MKKIMFVIVSLVCGISVVASPDYYDQKLEEYITTLMTKSDVTTNTELIYNFERLVKTKPNRWEAKYYLAYCMYRDALMNQSDIKYKLDQAVKYIDSIDNDTTKEHVDFLILRARILFTQLSIDPTKGPALGPAIISLLETSLQKEPNNSRAYYVKGMYYYYVPKFAGGDRILAKEYFKKAYDNYLKESNTSIPRWVKELYLTAISLE